jgi:hypothetical protein
MAISSAARDLSSWFWPGVQHGQVVVGLGQLGVFFGQLGEGDDGFVVLARIGLGHAAQKAQLRVARGFSQALVGLGQGVGGLAGLEQLGDFVVVVGVGQAGSHQGCQGQQAQESGESAADVLHGCCSGG